MTQRYDMITAAARDASKNRVIMTDQEYSAMKAICGDRLNLFGLNAQVLKEMSEGMEYLPSVSIETTDAD